jgi:hypothetical protein
MAAEHDTARDGDRELTAGLLDLLDEVQSSRIHTMLSGRPGRPSTAPRSVAGYLADTATSICSLTALTPL